MLARRSLLRRGAARVVFVVISLALTACQSASLPSFTAAPITPSMKSEQQSLKTASLTIVPSPVAPSPTPAPSTTPTVAPTPVPSPTTKPTAIVVDFSKVHPNELGVIPIMEYHLIGDADARWSRSWQHFRGDLERLYQAGYRTVPLQDVIDDRIDVPAGYSPVVLTFDDSSPGQFTLVEQNGKLVPDPHCAVGILDAFYREHRDFGEHATFFVLPAADPPHNLFGQDQYQKQKLDYLVAHGMEIGNHTYWHQNLSEVGDAEVKRQIGQAVQVIDTLVPGYDVDLFALPQGAWPKDKELAIDGTWKGISYDNRAVLLVGAEPAPSPDRVGYDAHALPRIQAIPEQLNLWFNAMDHNPNYLRYVSDGNPNTIAFPASLATRLRAKPGEKKLASPDPSYDVVQLR